MGTVGLSFGSPTSGTGFDVSSTVASIVSNLRNVETPWKTQLSSLQSQDTAISSLGTLLSTVSTDLSNLTDFTGILAQKTGSSSNTDVLSLTSATSSSVAGTHTVVVKNIATTSSGYLDEITNSSDTLSGTITITVGSGSAQTITVGTKSNTLAGLASAINSAGIGVTASVLTDSTGSRLSLVSGTSGKSGQIVVSSAIKDTTTSTTLGYNSSATGADANLVVDGVSLTSASNTVTDLIPGLTFQLLAPNTQNSDGSYNSVQVVIGNDVTSAGSAVNAFVSDYNALVSAMNQQAGYDSSGSAEPLFGSPTLSLLQQQLMAGIINQNPNGTLDSVSTNTGTTLGGTLSISVGSGSAQTITLGQIGALTANSAAIGQDFTGGTLTLTDSSGVAHQITLGTAGSTDTLANLAATINADDYGISAQVNTSTMNGNAAGAVLTLTASNANAAVSAADVTTAAGTVSLGGTRTASAADYTIQGLAAQINQANLGVTASVKITGTLATLALQSATAGSAGALAVSSALTATSDTLLSYSGTSGTDAVTSTNTSATTSTGTLSSITNASDTLSGSISIQVGSGTAQTVNVDSSNPTLAGLAAAINSAKIGVTASVVTNSDGSSSLSLLSGISGSAGTLNVTSSILDTSNTSSTSVAYNNSSDLTTLTALGVSFSSNYNGMLSLDSATLYSALNSDFSSVTGFFQGGSSWGSSLTQVLNNVGTSSSKGVLSLSLSSNSSSESMLNANLSREESMISAQQKSLTAELNSANEILQAIPTQLKSISMIYSAITGYGTSSS